MARSIWSGFLSFGLVSVPVGLFSATRDQGVHFNQFEKGTSDRIRYKKVNERTGEEVASSDIVRGVDLGAGEYVLVTNEELKKVAPGKSETIEISDFVALEEIDPLYFQNSYYLAPRGKGADRAYGLLRQAMLESKRVGVANFVIRDKQYLVAVRPAERVLILETMYFADQVRDPAEELDTLPEEVTFEGRELDVAKMLIDSLTVTYEPNRYHDEYHQRIEDLIAEKREGRTVSYEPERPVTNVVNLMDALKASIAKVKGTAVEDEAPAAAKAPSRAKKSTTKATATNAAADDAAAGNEQQSFGGMTKADLMARATELEVEGRSKMSKDELVNALLEHSRSRKVS